MHGGGSSGDVAARAEEPSLAVQPPLTVLIYLASHFNTIYRRHGRAAARGRAFRSWPVGQRGPGAGAAALRPLQRRTCLLQHPGKAAGAPRSAGSRAGRGAFTSLLPPPCPAPQWSLGLPWSDSISGFPGAVFGDDLLVAFTGLDGRQWELVGAAIAGPDAGRVQWTAEFPLGSQLPSTIAVAGELAVLELDGRVFAVDPRNGTVRWNATSPCSLGDPRMVDTRCVRYLLLAARRQWHACGA